jgi:hypothetical protein
MVTDLAVRGFSDDLIQLAHSGERINVKCYSCINEILRKLHEEPGTRSAYKKWLKILG